MNEKNWITEYVDKNLGFTLKIKEMLLDEQTPYQHIQVAETERYGRILILDGVFQTSVKEEWTYHEMITNIPMMAHPNPERVLIIGGGDGGAAREILRHETVKQLDICEIDKRVVEVSQKYFPTISKEINEKNGKLKMHIGDGIAFVKEIENFYDLIIIDCSDPIGPGEGLFTRNFYKDAKKALRKNGIIVQQTESPIVQQKTVHEVYKAMTDVFTNVNVFLAYVPIYPECLHSFMAASDDIDIRNAKITRKHPIPMKYYNEEVQKSAFVLPEFIKEAIYKGKYTF